MVTEKHENIVSKTDYYCRNFEYEYGKILVASEYGYWECYEDGSGCFCDSDGDRYFSFDKQTGEIKPGSSLAKWQPESFYKGWMEDYESFYAEKLRPLKDMIQSEGIYPAYQAAAVSISSEYKASCEKTAISETVWISTELFEEIKTNMEGAANKNFRDAAVTDEEVSRVLAKAYKESAVFGTMRPMNNLVNFVFENEHFTLSWDSFKPILQARKEVSCQGAPYTTNIDEYLKSKTEEVTNSQQMNQLWANGYLSAVQDFAEFWKKEQRIKVIHDDGLVLVASAYDGEVSIELETKDGYSADLAYAHQVECGDVKLRVFEDIFTEEPTSSILITKEEIEEALEQEEMDGI